LTSRTGVGFSSLGLFSGLKIGNPDENPVEFKLPFKEAASSATKEQKTDVSIWAEDAEAASLAATAAAASFAFLLSSSVVWKGANGTDWVNAGWDGSAASAAWLSRFLIPTAFSICPRATFRILKPSIYMNKIHVNQFISSKMLHI